MTAARERQLTHDPGGKVLTNAGVWSPGGEWVVFDARSDPAGSVFDGRTLYAVHAVTGATRALVESGGGACCGVATWHPSADRVVFILGPGSSASDGWTYAPARRQGVVFDLATGAVEALDARDLVPPFTPGALSGGSHVHQFSPDGRLVSFTYDDHLLTERGTNARTVGVAEVGRPVTVPPTHARNHSGSARSGLVVSPGAGEIVRAREEAWVGAAGYTRADGVRQRYALAFQGDVQTPAGVVTELFVADLPDRVDPPARVSGEVPFPALPGVSVRRLTFTAGEPRPGLGGPRHWPRSSPDGACVAFLRLDDGGAAKLWTVPTAGGTPRQVPHTGAVESAFTWHPDGERIACVVAVRVALVDARTGGIAFLTTPGDPPHAPRPEACVVSPDGRLVAFVRNLLLPGGGRCNQVCVSDVG